MMNRNGQITLIAIIVLALFSLGAGAYYFGDEIIGSFTGQVVSNPIGGESGEDLNQDDTVAPIIDLTPEDVPTCSGRQVLVNAFGFWKCINPAVPLVESGGY